MKLNIIKIGNSKGIRLPKFLIKQLGFKEIINAEIKNGQLILSIIEKPRAGWDEAFKAMAKAGDDKLLDTESFSLDSDEKEWKW